MAFGLSPYGLLTYGVGSGSIPVARTAADSVPISDSVRAVVSAGRSASDAFSLSDAVARALVLPRTAADTAVPSDAVARSLVLMRAVADTAAPTDTARANVGRFRFAADGLSIADAVAWSGSWIHARFASDAVSVADSLAWYYGPILPEAAVVSLPGGGFFAYTVGDTLTIRYTLPQALDGSLPNLNGAALTLYLLTPSGLYVTLSATVGPFPGSMQAPYVPPVAGLYRVEGGVVYADGTVRSGLPVGTFTVNPPLF